MTDLDAQTRLGAQLLTGHGAPFSPHEGIRTLMRATDQGAVEAPRFLATLSAMGAGLPQSWTNAFELLALAAARGSLSAQGQLKVLSQAPSTAENWDELCKGIDIDPWLAAADKRVLSQTPRVRMLDQFISPAVCQWLIGLAEGQAVPAHVYDVRTGGALAVEARSNTALELSIVQLDVVAVLVRARIAAATSVPTGALEPPQILHYDVGQKFDPHYDFLDLSEPAYARDVAQRGQRIITVLIYLNDGYEGGQTQFIKTGLRVKGAPGDAVMFANVDPAGAPDPATFHAGAPPTSGEKWLFSQWIRDKIPAPVG